MPLLAGVLHRARNGVALLDDNSHRRADAVTRVAAAFRPVGHSRPFLSDTMRVPFGLGTGHPRRQVLCNSGSGDFPRHMGFTKRAEHIIAPWIGRIHEFDPSCRENELT
jgi:hypothetical protein